MFFFLFTYFIYCTPTYLRFIKFFWEGILSHSVTFLQRMYILQPSHNVYFFLCHGIFIYLIFTDTLSQFIFFNTKDKTNLLTFFRIYYDNLYNDGIEFIDNVMIAHSKISYMSLSGKLLIILSKSESVAT